MNKEQFLEELEKHLDILTTEAKEEELKKYQTMILSGEQIDIEKIVKEIYLRRGINPEKVLKKDKFIYSKFEELFKIIHNVVEKMSENNLEENVKIILDLLVLIFLICLIKIPFILVRNLGDSLLEVINVPPLLTVWGLIIDIVYIIVAFIVFINIFSKWFKNIKTKKGKKIKGKALESISLEEENK